MGKDELEARKDSEPEVPEGDISPPSYLNTAQKEDFIEVAEILSQMNLMTKLDVDILAQYCIAKWQYIKYTRQIKSVINKNFTAKKWAAISLVTNSCEDAEELKSLLKLILNRQRGDDLTVLQNLQDKAFKQCLSCARELGLTISSRCKIIVPQSIAEDDEGDSSGL